ncbi:MAG: hypothetical protein AUJ92_04415 [Armatimonadetes bacterium CG2_30_59_28]|nr:MAG: hypothetical protein AUJ92_04415 [Armatimonadetes bacterium CG2_30_59_28]PIU67601.1 MAG: hypothetical protein COS85_00080 [Armatimonadetes bacterium CG07_land_8_20_14_0_80_59_28]PIX42043.1 MAG: hypothetical protein COZ56_10290 [Armatimonadetes bacterium CG_4_8_14_3_um_filter_58_9]PIY42770.1 MAG: hypothetical protein COZ05_13025 [Armatimonadetes bacterium CG_4_10_14_3_um_filter_59_10]PJB66731.1 MAG: hypothetical protein CO095_12800 [Armatimonadetes bacterium CG_4_9_14_3_um_filter_58_7]
MTQALLSHSCPVVIAVYHAWAHDQFGRIQPPLLTCESVISEACFLLRHRQGGAQSALSLVVRG